MFVWERVYAYSIFLGPVKKAFDSSAFLSILPFMVFLAFFSILMFFGGRVMEKLGPRSLGIIGDVIVGLGWLAIAHTATATFFGMKNYARNYGVVFFAYGLGAIIGGIISGQAKDVFGTYTFAFYPTAVLAFVGLVLAFLLIKPPQKK
jgi:predicted MFS family arabinose efflux permease